MPAARNFQIFTGFFYSVHIQMLKFLYKMNDFPTVVGSVLSMDITSLHLHILQKNILHLVNVIKNAGNEWNVFFKSSGRETVEGYTVKPTTSCCLCIKQH